MVILRYLLFFGISSIKYYAEKYGLDTIIAMVFRILQHSIFFSIVRIQDLRFGGLESPFQASQDEVLFQGCG
jgi:hypothetical protein